MRLKILVCMLLSLLLIPVSVSGGDSIDFGFDLVIENETGRAIKYTISGESGVVSEGYVNNGPISIKNPCYLGQETEKTFKVHLAYVMKRGADCSITVRNKATQKERGDWPVVDQKLQGEVVSNVIPWWGVEVLPATQLTNNFGTYDGQIKMLVKQTH